MNTEASRWTPNDYIQTRIKPNLELLSQKASGNLRCYRRVNRYGIYCITLIPVLIFLWNASPKENSLWIQIIIVVASIISITLNSLKFLGQYVEDANKYTMQKSLIEKELSFYLTRTQAYKESNESLKTHESIEFSSFVSRVEHLLSY